MATQRTFSIIKPDATRRNLTGAINAKIEEAGLRIVGQKRIHMTKAQAEAFYAVHAERPFYNDLVSFMISGPVVVQVLEGENAVTSYREIMGATNPADAADGTIRKLFAESSLPGFLSCPTCNGLCPICNSVQRAVLVPCTGLRERASTFLARWCRKTAELVRS